MSALEQVAIPEFTLADRIRRARTHKGLEQVDVAKALGVSRSLVSMWERELSEPRVSQLREIATLTDVPEHWLFSGSTSQSESAPSLTLLRGGAPEQLQLSTFSTKSP